MMRLLLGLSAAAGLASCTPSEPPLTSGMTLADLAGHYDAGPAACASANSPMNLTIAADRVSFYESSCRVLAEKAVAQSVEARLACTGEGEAWTESRTFTPTPIGVIVSLGGQAVLRSRCN